MVGLSALFAPYHGGKPIGRWQNIHLDAPLGSIRRAERANDRDRLEGVFQAFLAMAGATSLADFPGFSRLIGYASLSQSDGSRQSKEWRNDLVSVCDKSSPSNFQKRASNRPLMAFSEPCGLSAPE